jgi:hypothetical protein
MSMWLSGLITGLVLGFGAGIICESESHTPYSTLQQEAVERGFAEWRLTHAHNGATEFRWLDKPKDSLPADR